MALLGNFFLDPGKILFLLALLPLIILYLIRPKPKEKTIPSLMFFMRDMKSDNAKSFFKTFTKDWLFWLQLLILLILALAIAKPYVNVPEYTLADHTIIVLDASASMQAMKEGKTRFEEAREIALDAVGKVNTIILARNIPLVVKEEVGAKEAREYLSKVKPSSTSTGIYDSARAAMDYASDGSHVMVISDFIETEVDSNINSVKRALKAKGAVVEFIPVAGAIGNIGIVDLVVKDEKTSVQVKNYYPEEKNARIKVGNIDETLTLGPGQSDVFTFSTPAGVTTLELDVQDDFKLDNKAIISTPEEYNLKVLVVTNNENLDRSNMVVAWRAISDTTNYVINTDIVVPPKSIKVDHDLIVLKDFDQGKILPGIFRDIEKKVKEGSSLLITGQRGLFTLSSLEPLLPVSFVSEDKEGSDIFKPEPEIESLTKDVNFGSVDYYFNTKPKPQSQVLAAAKKDNGTLIAVQKKGKGKIFYYGIFDDDVKIDGKEKTSTFKNNLYYPIFLKRMIDFLTDTPSVENLNQKTGMVVRLAKGENVKTPGGSMAKGTFMLENQGVYNFKNQNIAANLLNSRESDVSGQFSEVELPKKDKEAVQTEEPMPLTMYFVIAGLILLLLELACIKSRGDM